MSWRQQRGERCLCPRPTMWHKFGQLFHQTCLGEPRGLPHVLVIIRQSAWQTERLPVCVCVRVHTRVCLCSNHGVCFNHGDALEVFSSHWIGRKQRDIPFWSVLVIGELSTKVEFNPTILHLSGLLKLIVKNLQLKWRHKWKQNKTTLQSHKVHA